MSNIPTAKEFLKNKDDYGNLSVYADEIAIVMIEFAKFHVEAALKAASEKANTIVHKHVHDEDEIDGYILIDIINKNSILNAYPLENIK